MLMRWGVIEGSLNPMQLLVTGKLPRRLTDAEQLDGKLKRDQKKLLAMLQYVKHEGDRKQYILEYFGLAESADL